MVPERQLDSGARATPFVSEFTCTYDAVCAPLYRARNNGTNESMPTLQNISYGLNIPHVA